MTLAQGRTDDNSDKSAPIRVHFNGSSFVLASTDVQPSKKALAGIKTERETLRHSVRQLLTHVKPPLSDDKCRELLSDVPSSWERHDDLVVLPSQAFNSDGWKHVISQLSDIWDTIASALRCTRLARNSEVVPDKYRSSCAVMLKGADPWASHIDNGIKYVFDVTCIMFSSGNIAEKLRVAQFSCRGETVVDLYAGIGYFTLPYLIHTHAETVHACEWNERAVEGLRRGLVANRVEEGRCIVHVGDCRKVSLAIYYLYTT